MQFITTLAIVIAQVACVYFAIICGAKVADKLSLRNQHYPAIAALIGMVLAVLLIIAVASFDLTGNFALTLNLSAIFFAGGICARAQSYYSDTKK